MPLPRSPNPRGQFHQPIIRNINIPSHRPLRDIEALVTPRRLIE